MPFNRTFGSDTDRSSVVEGVPAGSLDGITVLRYVHIYRDRASGGIEQQLRLLNHGLLQRHRLTIVQTHLVREEASSKIEIEESGQGRIIWVPAYIRESESAVTDLFSRTRFVLGKSFALHMSIGCRPFAAAAYSTAALLHHRGGHLRYRFTVLSDHLNLLLDKHNVDLLLMHWLSYDTHRVIEHGASMHVPFAIINHFDNLRFALPAMSQWMEAAAAIGSVSGQGLPEALRDRCVNLADAIDTDFFNKRYARPLQIRKAPIILLHPARIQIDKGHDHIVRVAQMLRNRGFDVAVYCVGAVDSHTVRRDVQRAVDTAGLTDHMTFLGEQNAVTMRDLFAASSVVLLPSRSEGLPRVLLEAQAMETPVVAYKCGGVSDALLPEKSGFLLEPGDLDGLAERVAFLLNNDQIRVQFGQTGREFVTRRFSIDALVRRHEVFYLNALSHSVRPALPAVRLRYNMHT